QPASGTTYTRDPVSGWQGLAGVFSAPTAAFRLSRLWRGTGHQVRTVWAGDPTETARPGGLFDRRACCHASRSPAHARSRVLRDLLSRVGTGLTEPGSAAGEPRPERLGADAVQDAGGQQRRA